MALTTQPTYLQEPYTPICSYCDTTEMVLHQQCGFTVTQCCLPCLADIRKESGDPLPEDYAALWEATRNGFFFPLELWSRLGILDETPAFLKEHPAAKIPGLFHKNLLLYKEAYQ